MVGYHHRNKNPLETNNSKCTQFSEFFKRDFGGMISQIQTGGLSSKLVHGNDIYFVGIIDTLIEYGITKFAEHHIKSFLHGNEHGISVSDPDTYAARFLAFISEIVE